MREFVYFALGALLSILLAPLTTEWIKSVRARRSQRLATERQTALMSRLQHLREYRDDVNAFTAFLLGRLILISLLWVAQELVDYVFLLAANVQFTALNFDYRSFENLAFSGQLTMTIASLIDVGFLVIVLTIAIRTYNVFRQVRNLDEHASNVESEIGRLAARSKTNPLVPAQPTDSTASDTQAL